MKYATHDGPGIRTTVFLKGCPLNCWWCHNPESQARDPEIMLREDRCIGCGECAQVCPSGAVVNLGGTLMIDPGKCTVCLRCVSVCHAEARAVAGRTVTVDEVMADVKKDVVFYDESGGGVTFSGGEPLMQPDFLATLLAKCAELDIHTAVETTGFGKLRDLLKISASTDLFLYDLKLMDDAAHRKYTGVSNRIIHDNLQELSRQHANIVVRIPIIPGVNDDEANLMATGAFVAGLAGVREIHLLPYHKAGVGKYQRLRRVYELPGCEPPDTETMSRMASRMNVFGKKIKIGG
ncbi:MAG TPA: glycyl-radical enzyme activating protein [Symbiobacteriaceae bacterium]|jgi:pyruvate formate lyase activating enzyme